MNLASNQALSIPFYGDTLYLVEHRGEPYTPMKPIVEAMGLAWQPQHRKFQDDPERFSITLMVIQLAGDIQKREVLLMPVRKLFGWMMTVSPNRVKPKIKDKVIQYQNECDDILWEHWSKKNTIFKAIEIQAADKIISLNHLQAICGHRRASATILYFFLQNENSDRAEKNWFKMSFRMLAEYIDDFSFAGLGRGLKYLSEHNLLQRRKVSGEKPPIHYKINHRVLKQKLRQHRLPAIHGE